MADKPRATDQEIERALADLPGWRREGKGLTKLYELGGFKAAMAFANTVAELADRADHHPDIHIQFHRVTLELWSHDAGGVTERDLRLARQIEAAARDLKA
jgi:4a-hydroxytetrahydrobiopterin dehydratase